LLQIQKRDEAIAQLQSEDKELKSQYKAACGRTEEAEKAREALQSEYEHIEVELRSHEEAMASLQERVEEEGERREEELNRCRKAIEELKQQLEDSEQGRVEQQHKVMVVNSRCSACREVKVVACASA
jgi:chromosome segregation ATPase